MSFIAERVQIEGLTFDDALLVPAYSAVLPRDVKPVALIPYKVETPRNTLTDDQYYSFSSF